MKFIRHEMKEFGFFSRLKHKFSKPYFKIDFDSIHFGQEAKSLHSQLTKFQVPDEDVVIVSAGAGLDSQRPLILANSLYPKAKKITLIMVDIQDNFYSSISGIQSLTNSFIYKNDSITASFHFKDKSVFLVYVRSNVSSWINSFQDPIDIYFERAFEIFREKDPNYWNCLRKLAPNFIAVDKELPGLNATEIAKQKNFGFYPDFRVFKIL